MKIEAAIYYQIRHLTAEGKSQREIAKLLGISRTTVKKYSDGSTMPGDRKGTSSRRPYKVTDEVIKFIKDCLLHDENEGIKKQQHTAERIHQRLVDELNFTGGKSTIRKIVSELKAYKTNKVFISLSFEPAEAAQIDWGEATVYLDSKKLKLIYFA